MLSCIQLLVMLCRPSTLNLGTLSSHIDAALDLVLLDYAGDVDTVRNCQLFAEYDLYILL